MDCWSFQKCIQHTRPKKDFRAFWISISIPSSSGNIRFPYIPNEGVALLWSEYANFWHLVFDTFTFKSSTLNFIVIRRFSGIGEMLLLLRLRLFAAALLVFLAFDGVNADGSEMYYRVVHHERNSMSKFHAEYCWRKNPINKEECLQNGNPGFNTLLDVGEGFPQ